LLPRINTRMATFASNASSFASSASSSFASSASSLASSASSFASNTVSVARKHSRISLVAASAAAAGIGAVGVSAVAPWAQASTNATHAVQVDSSLVAWGNSASHAASSLKTGGQGIKLTSLRAAGTGGSTGQTATAPGAGTGTGTVAAKHAAPVRDAKHVAPARDAKHAAPARDAKHAAPVQEDAKVVNGKAATANKATARHAHRNFVHKPAVVTPSRPYTIYDSVTPGAIPTGQHAAVYVNGAYAASANQAAGHGSVLWIDTNGSDPNANVLDVEPGDATPAGAAAWAQQRLSEHPHSVAIVYTMLSDWSEVKADVAGLPQWMQPHVHYWIADPTGVPHVVAGASATQWYWGNSYDLTTAIPGFEG
jgi:hypothetical protein